MEQPCQDVEDEADCYHIAQDHARNQRRAIKAVRLTVSLFAEKIELL